MPWFIPLATSAASAVGGFIIRRRVAIVAGTLVVTYYDEAGEAIGNFIGEEAAQQAEEAATEAGGTVISFVTGVAGDIGEALEELGEDIKEGLVDAAGQFGNLSLNFVRGLASAVIEGIDDAYDLVRDKLRGKEPDVIAGFTVGTISILAAVFIYQRVKAREI